MAQAVSHWFLTAEARVHVHISPCVICGGQSDTGTGFIYDFSVFSYQYHSTVALRAHISPGFRCSETVSTHRHEEQL
jgi:hypothetical protein